MRKFAIFITTAIIAVSVAFSASAQERVNGEVFSFSENSKVVSDFTGWYYYKSTAQWIGNENCIDYQELPSNRVGKFVKGNKNRNLQEVQMKSFSHNGEVFYVLDVMRNGGAYTYPAIREDWIGMYEHCAFLISKADYEKIVSPSDEVCEFYVPYVEWMKHDDNELIRKLIRVNEKFNSEDNDIIKRVYGKRFAVKKYNDVVRFLWEDSYGEWLSIGVWDREEAFTNRKPLNTLSDVYFETNLSEWETALSL